MSYITGNRRLLLIAIIIIVTFSAQIPSMPSESKEYPSFLLVCCLILCLALLFKKDQGALGYEKGDMKRLIIFSLMIVLYLLLLDKIGYIISTLLFLVSSLLFLGLKSRNQLFFFPVGVTLTLYFLFSRVLAVILPEGTWFGLVF
ncbi:tripartite tricarboxylate transporter TctB family protein [uncultured Sphaerochaeta sp.]|uniref:tripartite tricarboxylate transporter TctB family protein n=1 Tax=uncultured Sphaerochaeta sp. TaxID=886478 RepID=UPI002A0A33F8|nr:tripartite tricarboxylate transporter TctB family protein [uncultured Sphaerochaeta sp.]